MTSGLAWDEWSSAHGTSANDIDNLYFNCNDVITCVLEKPWWAVPGEFFTYNGGGIAILGEIIRNASGMNIEDFSNKYLFEPLNISSATWDLYPDGSYDTAGSLRITPRAMLKLGLLYLNDGECFGKKIIDKEWVDKSSISYRNNVNINIPGEDSGSNGYGYTWWNSTFEIEGKQIYMFRAGGWGGQEIMVFPGLDMVVVFTGGNYDKKTELYEIVENYILPAINE
jgi:CubicO group peptidase (beta-lactamase class C family)